MNRHDATVLAMLREFGTPADVAGRYRSPGLLVIPAEQTRVFVPLAVGGIALQWALTLPRVIDDLPLVAWWFGAGLGALWWPGFLAMMWLLASWLRARGWIREQPWTPRTFDPERVDRRMMAFGLAAFVVGVALVAGLPWTAARLPAPMPQVFAFDPQFLQSRAWPVLPLWAGLFAAYVLVALRGRWSTWMRHVELVLGAGFVVLIGWWLAAGPIFLARATDEGAKAALGLVIVICIVELVRKTWRQGVRIRTPRATRAT